MKDRHYKGGPISAAFVLDSVNNDWVSFLMLTPTPDESLGIAAKTCMQQSMSINGIDDMRVVMYEFPALGPIPKPTKRNAQRYYHDLLMPVVDKLGLVPSAEIHSKEIAFAMLNDIPIELGKPENCIRQRSDYADFVKTFSGGFDELKGKDTPIILAPGEKVVVGLKTPVQISIDHACKKTHHIPSVPAPEPKHGVS